MSTTPNASPPRPPIQYLILSVLHSDEFTKKIVWMKEGGGFTADFEEAARFTPAEAAKIQGDGDRFVMVDPCGEQMAEFHYRVEIHLDSPAQKAVFADLVAKGRNALNPPVPS